MHMFLSIARRSPTLRYTTSTIYEYTTCIRPHISEYTYMLECTESDKHQFYSLISSHSCIIAHSHFHKLNDAFHVKKRRPTDFSSIL